MALDTKFWKDAGERAAKTVAQTAVALFAASGGNLVKLDLKNLALVSLTAGLVSVLTSIGSAKVNGDSSSASLVDPPK